MGMSKRRIINRIKDYEKLRKQSFLKRDYKELDYYNNEINRLKRKLEITKEEAIKFSLIKE